MKNFTLFIFLLITSYVSGQSVSIVKDINPNGSSLVSSDKTYYASMDGYLFFGPTDGSSGRELWKSDGTNEGTVLVKEINPAGSSNLSNFVVVNETLFFFAKDDTHGYELWKSDGTEEGTVMVKDIYEGSGDAINSTFGKLYATSNYVFFEAWNPDDKERLYRSDGTMEGTFIINETMGSTNIEIYGASDTEVFFTANGTFDDDILWKSDGTDATATMVYEFDSDYSYRYQGAYSGGHIYFYGKNNALNKNLIYVSDGTSAGTKYLEDINFSDIKSLYSLNGELYITGTGDSYSGDLFKASPDQVSLIREFDTFSSFSTPFDLVEYDGDVYFYAFDDTTGDGLYKYDGNSVEIVYEFLGYSTSFTRSVHNAGDRLLITAEANTNIGFELFESFGSESTTSLVKDIYTGSNSSVPNNFININDKVFFSATESADNVELFLYDPFSAAGLSASILQEEYIDCFGDETAELEVNITSGTAPFEFDWTPSSVTGSNPKNLGAGTYTVTITDANDMVEEYSYTINQPTELSGITGSIPAINNESNGKAFIKADGGTKPYLYMWSESGASEFSDTLFNVSPGDYSVTVVDNNDCELERSITVDNIVGISDKKWNNINVFPTITQDIVNISNPENLAFSVKLIDSQGKIYFTSDKAISIINVDELSSNKYFIILSDDTSNQVFSIFKL